MGQSKMLFTKTSDIIKLQSDIKSLQRKLRFAGGDSISFNRSKILLDQLVKKDQLELLMKS